LSGLETFDVREPPEKMKVLPPIPEQPSEFPCN
jgi:hypothetical protein